jgi:membrane protein
MGIGTMGRILWTAANRWLDDRCTTMGAAVANYMVFSLGPLLLLVIAVAGAIWGAEAAEGAILRELGGLLGDDGARGVQALLVAARDTGEGRVASIISLVVLLITATTVMAELQSALNVVWRTEPRAGLDALVRVRLASFALIAVTGLLLLVSLAVSAALSFVTTWIGGLAPGVGLAMQALDFVITFAVVTALFAAAYKILPDSPIAWRDVGIASVVSALLFTVGKHLIGLYIGTAGIMSVYGAAGTLAVILIWVYYSVQIFLFGAELAKAYADHAGSHNGTALDRRPDDAVKAAEAATAAPDPR